MQRKTEIYVVTAQKDELLRLEFEAHLTAHADVFDVWHRNLVHGGGRPDVIARERLATASIVVLLVSADYFGCPACRADERLAFERRRDGVRIIPVLVRACAVPKDAFEGVEVLPRGGPVAQRLDKETEPERDARWKLVVEAIRKPELAPCSDVASTTGRDELRTRGLLPAYENEATRQLAEQLEDAYARRDRLAAEGVSVDFMERELRELRSALREGGQLRAGDSLGDGRYLLLNPVGRGGFASVWRVRDKATGDVVAVKVLHPTLSGDTRRRERFYRGARLMGKLAHSGVVRVLAEPREDGRFHYFIMEYVGGGSLAEVVKQQRLPAERALAVVLAVGAALGEAHASGIWHRDVKPENVLLTEDGKPKLCDFDLVGAKETTGGTGTGAMGTFVYAAPELMENANASDARADVFGLGMTAVFCLRGADIPATVFRNAEPVLSALPCSDAVKAVLRTAIAWEREARPADARAFCGLLQRAIETGVNLEAKTRQENTSEAAGAKPKSADETVGSTSANIHEAIELSLLATKIRGTNKPTDSSPVSGSRQGRSEKSTPFRLHQSWRVVAAPVAAVGLVTAGLKLWNDHARNATENTISQVAEPNASSLEDAKTATTVAAPTSSIWTVPPLPTSASNASTSTTSGCQNKVHGNKSFTKPGTYKWTAPNGVCEVTATVIGGGGGGCGKDARSYRTTAGAPGEPGNIELRTVFLDTSRVVQVVVGAGGPPVPRCTDSFNCNYNFHGGFSKFGFVTARGGANCNDNYYGRDAKRCPQSDANYGCGGTGRTDQDEGAPGEAGAVILEW
ncbi:protein kinase domain-containing protein [Polyangium aurulentum]|uniref:protein kinase domain-containing protein n=1 Tax=Polyangium aurulentum TaxID=2567896 RepID=UPI0010AE275E|nr:protein kinase [Polyangium aurulentum]UQA61780.1 protein kinase [Polyangium aurulentum]